MRVDGHFGSKAYIAAEYIFSFHGEIAHLVHFKVMWQCPGDNDMRSLYIVFLKIRWWRGWFIYNEPEQMLPHQIIY